jgi:hypothetical protein
MVCADAAPVPAIKTNNAKPNEVRFTALPSHPNTSLFLLQIFARRLIEINAPARQLKNQTARGCQRQPLGERGYTISSTDDTSNDTGRRF